MNPENILESFILAGKMHYACRNAAGRIYYASATGSFKGAGSVVISKTAYNQARRNPAASIPKLR